MSDARQEIARGPRGFVESDGERIWLESYGAGDAVVFGHGLGGNRAVWFQQVPVFARRFRVVTWDQRAFGRSTNRTDRPGPAAAVRDLTALLDHLGVDAAHLVGQSMGGWSALGLALERPERVRSLVLADTIAGIYTAAIRRDYEAFARRIGSEPPVQERPVGHHPALGEAIRRRDPARAFLYEQIGDTPHELQLRMRDTLLGTEYPRELLAALTVPVLFVVGSDDPIFTPRMIREAAEVVPDGRVVEIPETGHSPYFEAPGAWNSAVLEFLDEVT